MTSWQSLPQIKDSGSFEDQLEVETVAGYHFFSSYGDLVMVDTRRTSSE